MGESRVALTPLDNTRTVRYRAFRTGRLEIWLAASQDGRWIYCRLETTGTPWEVIDTHASRVDGDPPEGHTVRDLFGTLRQCRRWTAEQPTSPQQEEAAA